MDLFTSGLHNDDPAKPSLFELLGQEQLRDLLQPAVKYVLSVFAQRYPRYLLRLVNKHEEFYALLMLIIERYYLHRYGASFAEVFHGLKRRRTPQFDPSRAMAAAGLSSVEDPLRQADLRNSLISLVGVPYLRAKARDYFEVIGGGVPSDLQRSRSSFSSLKGKALLKELYRISYPWCNALFEVWLMTYNIRYIVDKTPYYRPWLSWMKIDIRRRELSDMNLLATETMLPEGQLQRLHWLLRRTPNLFLDSLRFLLPTAIFLLRFLEWWYSPNSPARALVATPSGPMVPPPLLLSPQPKGLPVDRIRYGLCPICNETITNATALPSGYVFCYRCAYSEVDEKKQCPVTLISVDVSQLRKVLV